MVRKESEHSGCNVQDSLANLCRVIEIHQADRSLSCQAGSRKDNKTSWTNKKGRFNSMIAALEKKI